MPRGDLRRTTEHVASRWLLDLTSAHPSAPDRSAALLALGAPWLRHVGSFMAGVSTEEPATLQEARVASVLAGRSLSRDRAYEAARRLLSARARPALSEYDGFLAGASLPSPAASGQVVSPTRLELWAGCPYAYYVRYVLGIEPVGNPEELLDLAPLDQGSLVHRVLEGYVADRMAARAPGGVDESLLRRHFELACRDAEGRGITGRPVMWQRRREQLWHDLVLFVNTEADWAAQEGAEPLAAELRFGFDGDPVHVALGGGRGLRFRGSADRVDRAGDGTLVVTDYKYASSHKYRDLGPDNPTGTGTLLQLPIYSLAARSMFDTDRLPLPVRARYAFARPDAWSGRLPPSKEVTVDDHVLSGWTDALAVIVDGIEHGLFPQFPPDDQTRFAGFVACPACDPDGLGTAIVQRRWQAIVDAPELAAYLRLRGLEPPSETDDDPAVGGAAAVEAGHG